jgi:hypothetical protein
MLLVLILLATNSYAEIGTVSSHDGIGCEIHRNKSKITGEKNSTIHSMDIYVTNKCVGHITFKDDTKVRVTENSRLLIDDFVYDSKKSDAGKLAIKVGMGTVRYASGQIAKTNPQRVDIKTPTATVAVRGTDFTMTVDESGQSLIVLIPSCKDENDVKKYELEENRCKVGQIDVSTLTGTVTLNQAFHATYVASATVSPTTPTLVNTIESKLNNTLIISKPPEVQRAIKESGKSKREIELEELEIQSQQQLKKLVAESAEQSRIIGMTETALKSGCNPKFQVCVSWEKPDAVDQKGRGRGIAFRNSENEHYVEVKTVGHQSNTNVIVIHNDVVATALIGDGSPGGNFVMIKQNSGVKR